LRPSEIWWVQSYAGNSGNLLAYIDTEAQVFKSLNESYLKADVFRYVPHDPGLRFLKSRIRGDGNFGYAYRV
jgi:hypothetical protein